MSTEILKYTGIDRWHAAGFTGKGIKVLVYEVANPTMINYPDYNGKVKDPLGICFSDIPRTHMEDVTDTELYFGPGTVEVIVWRDSLPSALQYCLDHDVDLFNYSASGGYSTDEFNELEAKCIANGTFFVCAAGNYGNEGLTPMSRKDTWLSVGALKLSPDGVAGRTFYSSYDGYGDDLDVMGFGDIIFPDPHTGSTKGVSGTSFAAPSIVGMLACFKQWFYEKNLRKPTWTETYVFVLDNCKDLEIVGYDAFTGNGVMVMPEVKPIRRLEVTMNSVNAFLNGVPKTLVTPPVILDARTQIGLRDISDLSGGTLVLSGQDITITWPGRVLKVTIGSTTAWLNGVAKTLYSAPKILNQRTHVGLRDISDLSGGQLTLAGQKITIVWS